MRGVRQQDLLRAAKQQVGVGKLVEGPRQAASRSSASTRPPTPALKNRAEILRPAQAGGLLASTSRSARCTSRARSPAATSHGRAQLRDRQHRRRSRSSPASSSASRRPRARAASCCPRTARSASGRARSRATAAWRRRPARARTRPSRRSSRAPAASCPSTTRRSREELAVHRPAALLQDRDPQRRRATRATGWSSSAAWSASTTASRAPPGRTRPSWTSESEKRKIGKRTFELHYDGDRLRLVAWRTPKAVYWVSNTLLQTLTERQMLAIARSTRLPVASRALMARRRNRSA